MASSDGNITCGFDGDENVYGLGIRLGTYLQWLATLLVYNFLPEEAASAEAVNISFQLSLFVALVYRTAKDPDFFAVEAYIMLMLCIGALFSRRGTYAVRATDTQLSELEKKRMHLVSEMATPVGFACGIAVDIGILCYGMWYIYTGMDRMQTDPCFSNTVFFFARLRLQGPFRRFVAAAFTIGCVIFGLMAWAIVKNFAKIIRNHTIWGLFSNVFNRDGQLIRQRNHQVFYKIDGEEVSDPFAEYTYTLSYIIPLDLIFFILSTELTVSYNSIRGVQAATDTGQLIPIVVGGASVLAALYEVFLKVHGKEFRKSPSFRYFPTINYLWSKMKKCL